jgi:hypothetical protein
VTAPGRHHFDAALCVNGVPRVLAVDQQLVIDTARRGPGVGRGAGAGEQHRLWRGRPAGPAAAWPPHAHRGNAGALHELGHAASAWPTSTSALRGLQLGETTQDSYNGAEPVEPNVTAATTLR